MYDSYDILFEEESELAFMDFPDITIPYHTIDLIPVHIEFLTDLFYCEVLVCVFCQSIVDFYDSRPKIIGNAIFFFRWNLVTRNKRPSCTGCDV